MDKFRRGIYILVALCVASLATNGFLTWHWQAERTNLRKIITSKEANLETATEQNLQLSSEKQAVQSSLSEKEKELQKLSADLATKQKELDAKLKELDAKTKELLSAQKQLDDQESQLAANASELSKLRNRPPLFSFVVKASNLSDVDAKKEAVKQVVTDAFDVIQEIYGKPYLLHSVTITFVEGFSNPQANGAILISNSDQGMSIDIQINDFDKDEFNDVNTIIHEVIHAFHGLAVLEPTGFEEGITVAAADVVMAKMISKGQLPKFSPLYIRLTESEYQSKMSSLTIPRDYNTFYGSSSASDFYQVMGKAWYELYKADSSFFIKFNEKIYEKKSKGQEVTEKMVLDTIKEVQPSADLAGAAWVLK